VQSNPELSTKSSSSQQPERQRKSRFATFFSSASGEAEEEDDDASAQAAPVSGLSVPSRHNLSSSGNALAQIPGAFPAMSQVEHQTLSAQPPLINLYQQQQQQQQIIGGLGMHRQDPMLTATAAVSMQGPPARMPAPSAVTAAPQILWLYKDPHGNIQGK
jgi:hypothetical protein